MKTVLLAQIGKTASDGSVNYITFEIPKGSWIVNAISTAAGNAQLGDSYLVSVEVLQGGPPWQVDILAQEPIYRTRSSIFLRPQILVTEQNLIRIKTERASAENEHWAYVYLRGA